MNLGAFRLIRKPAHVVCRVNASGACVNADFLIRGSLNTLAAIRLIGIIFRRLNTFELYLRAVIGEQSVYGAEACGVGHYK